MSESKEPPQKSGGRGGDALVKGDDSTAQGGLGGEAVHGEGGAGGHAWVVGNRSDAIGGRGGRGGLGPGGPGGPAEVFADDTFAVGGQGGEASQVDGRGGRGGRAYLGSLGDLQRRPHVKRPYGEPNNEPGRGGDAPDTPQYKARRLIIENLKERYFRRSGLPLGDIWYDRNTASVGWLNKQLEIEGHRWRVSVVDFEYEFTDIQN